MPLRTYILTTLLCLTLPFTASAAKLSWPIACIPGIDCLSDNVFHISYPDIDGDGKAFDCGPPGYRGHTGTDITVNSVEEGVAVLAADDGVVLWVSGGKYDQCPNDNEPDCRPELRPVIGVSSTANCTDFPACGAEDCCLSWGFNAGNFIFIRHDGDPDIAVTFYAHLRRGSIIVANGQRVRKGDKIAEVGSSGASLTPHLHFGVWSKNGSRLQLADPWAGKCGPNFDNSLWQFTPPYRADVTITKNGTGTGIVAAAGGELSCGNSCATSMAPGAVITLRATPYSGSEFVRWEGGCAGTANSCTFVAQGSKKVAAVFRDTAPPSVRSLTFPALSASLTVPISSFSSADNVKVVGYLVSETPTQPAPAAASWQKARPSSYTCSSPGKKTIYAWVKDAAGNISSRAETSVVCGAVSSAQNSLTTTSPPPQPLAQPRADGT